MYFYRLIMKSKGEPDIVVPAHVIDRDKLYPKLGEENHWVTLKNEKFNCMDVKRAVKFWEPEQQNQSAQQKNILSQEKREENQARFRAYYAAMSKAPEEKRVNFTPQQIAWYEEMKLCIDDGIYPKSDWRHAAGINRRDWHEARKVFFDVYFESIEHEQATHKAYYYRYIAGKGDPRTFNRAEFVEACKDPDVMEAEEIFNG